MFSISLKKDERITHALNRLTFGARPGDYDRVRKMGLKKWIELQLHPERVPENPVLAAKLRPLDTLTMNAAEMAVSYPPPQLIRAMVDGRVPFPADPEKRAMIRKLAERFRRRLGQSAPEPERPPDISTLLTPAQLQVIRGGTPRQKLDLISAVPPDRQEEVLEALPPGVRYQVYPLASTSLRRKMGILAGPQRVVTEDLADAKLYRAVYSNHQLEEILVDFWYNHFNVSLDKGADHYLVTSYERDAIRPHVLGKFEDLLLATARSPAMLFYLDNWQSAGPNNKVRRARGLNENYGRELLELHTLGVDGGYTQKDVTEVARCFTGWTLREPQRGGTFFFDPKMHDDGEKTVLGVRIPPGGGQEDGLQVLHMVAHHPSTARFIARQLAQRFVADAPPDSLVEKMARTFREKDGDLRAVLETLFRAPEFWSRGAYRSKMKSPFELVASAVRASGGEVDFGYVLAGQVAQLGEPLYRKLEPTGYSNSGQEWVSTAGLLARMNFGVALASNHIQGVTVHADPALGLALGSPAFQRR